MFIEQLFEDLRVNYDSFKSLLINPSLLYYLDSPLNHIQEPNECLVLNHRPLGFLRMMRLEFENGASQYIVNVDLRFLASGGLVETLVDKGDKSIEEGFAFSPHERVLLPWVVAFEHVQEEHYRLLAERIFDFLTEAFNRRSKIISDLNVLEGKQSSDNKVFNILDRKQLLDVRSVERVEIVNQFAILNESCQP